MRRYLGTRGAPVTYGAGTYDECANRPLANVTSVEEIHACRWLLAREREGRQIASMSQETPAHSALWKVYRTKCWKISGYSRAAGDAHHQK